MRLRKEVPILASYSTKLAVAQQVTSMSSLDWTLSGVGQFNNISVPGTLPSQAHLDLYAAQAIGDPYYGLNDFNLRWVAETNWTYTARLGNLKQTSNQTTWLLFNGLDTFSTIELCGQMVASTNNQFRQYFFDVSDILDACSGTPDISINFGSAPNIATELAEAPGAETWPVGVELSYEFPNRQFIRKEQSDFGWDWGPAFAPAGVWQPAYVVQTTSSELYVRNTLLDIYRQGQLNSLPPDQSQPWMLNASIDVLGAIPSDAALSVSIMDSNNKTVTKTALGNITSSNVTITGSVLLDNIDIELWWPNGLGPQNLYYATVDVTDSSNSTLASITKRTGFRTIVLNQGQITDIQLSQGIANGTNFHFEINGHEFYAKGSNFIPPDAFWPRVTETKMNQLFQSIVDAGQNMLRVWASGAYQPDFIYDLADQYGVLMWSEFEFSDALYPVAQDFLDNVREEADYNVRRVNHHPSLALWAGGNELESLELLLANDTDPNDPRWTLEYEQLFIDVLLPVVWGNSHSISYMPSSTENGYLVLNHSSATQPLIERYNNKTAGYIYGDTDYYNYDSLIAFNQSSYPIGRFANEFGFHSMPSLQSWQEAISPEDLYFNSSVIELRNHHYPSTNLNTSNFANSTKGMGEMTVAVGYYYPIPALSDPVANFSAWCHATQIFQADFYRSQISFYRRGSGMPERQLGSLYWQLEDIWQAPTWAGIEYDGRWKVLHYIGKDIYQPVIIAPYWNYTSGDLTAYVTSSLWSSASGTASFTWYDYSGKVISTKTASSANFTVGALNTTKVMEANTNTSYNFDLSNAVLRMNVSATGELPNSNTTSTFTHEFFFHPILNLADAQLQDPGLQLSHSNSSGNVTFTVAATKGVSAWTWLDFPSGVLGNFESNAFWLVPGESKDVGFTLKNDTTGGAWVNEVTVQSLWDLTEH